MSEAMKRINRAGRRLSALSLLLMIATPVLLAAFWVVVPYYPLLGRSLPATVNPEHPGLVLILGFWASMIPGAVTMYGFGQLRRLFKLYAEGTVFESANVGCFRRLGWTLIAFTGAQVLTTPVLGMILTLYNPPGQRMLILSLSSNELISLLVGAVVLTIAWVMDEARMLKRENEMFV